MATLGNAVEFDQVMPLNTRELLLRKTVKDVNIGTSDTVVLGPLPTSGASKLTILYSNTGSQSHTVKIYVWICDVSGASLSPPPTSETDENVKLLQTITVPAGSVSDPITLSGEYDGIFILASASADDNAAGNVYIKGKK